MDAGSRRRSISLAIVLRAVLKLTRHRAGRIAASVPDIDIHAVAAARYRSPIAISTALCRLVLWRDHAVRISVQALEVASCPEETALG